MIRTGLTNVSHGLCCLLCLAMWSCTTNQGRFTRLGENVAARDANCVVDVFQQGLPNKNYLKVARLDVHIEKTHFIQPAFDDAVPELKKQACLSGADAVIEVQERSSYVLETGVYHVTATGVKYIN